MKQLLGIIFLAFATAYFAGAQSKSDRMYDAFENKDGVSTFSFSKSMLDLIDLDLGDDGNERNVTGDLHRIRFMSYNPEKGEISGAEFIENAIALLPAHYKKYIDDDIDDDEQAEIWLLGKKNKFKECHIFIHNNDANQMRFIVSFYGDFTVNDLKKLKQTSEDFSENK
jgi:hypothetical protein